MQNHGLRMSAPGYIAEKNAKNDFHLSANLYIYCTFLVCVSAFFLCLRSFLQKRNNFMHTKKKRIIKANRIFFI